MLQAAAPFPLKPFRIYHKRKSPTTLIPANADLVTAFGKGVFIAVFLIKKSEYVPKTAMEAIPLTTAPVEAETIARVDEITEWACPASQSSHWYARIGTPGCAGCDTGVRTKTGEERNHRKPSFENRPKKEWHEPTD